MDNKFAELETGTIKSLLENIAHNFSIHKKADETIIEDYSAHFDLYVSLVESYARNWQKYDSLYPAIKAYKWGEFSDVHNKYKSLNPDSHGMQVVLILMEELKSTKL